MLLSNTIDFKFRHNRRVNGTLNSHRRGVILVALSTLAWSTGGLFTRIVALDGWTMLAWRGLFGAAALALFQFTAAPRAAAAGFKALRGWSWAFVASSAAGSIMFITSLTHTTVAHVAVIYAVLPFLSAGLGWAVLGESPSRSALGASGIALAGVLIMVGFGGAGQVVGDLLALGMTGTMALQILLARRHPELPLMACVCAAALLSGVLAWHWGSPLKVSGRDLLLLALFGTVNLALGFVLFTQGSRLLPTVETALLSALDAPLAPLWIWLVFREAPTQSTGVGGGLVFAAVAAHLAVGRPRSRGCS